MRSVSSSFLAEAAKTNAQWRRRFLLGTSNYAAYVTKWPTIQTRWNDINPRNISLEVANENRAFNWFMDEPANMHTSCTVQVGFDIVTGNLYQQSEVFSSTNWTDAGLTFTGSAVPNPVNSLYTATRINEVNSYQQHYIHQTKCNVTSLYQQFVQSIYVRAIPAAGRSLMLRPEGTGGRFPGTPQAVFHPDSGTVTSVQSGCTANMSSLGGGWWRCSLVTTLSTSTGNGSAFFYMTDTASPTLLTYSGDVANGLYVFGAQLERFNAVRDYVATTTSASPNDEFITAFSGTVDVVRYRDGAATLSLIDKFRKLADRVIGSNTSAQNYLSSNYLVHDLAWYACTSHGGLSSVRSTSNPDIDYASFTSWTAIWSTDNVRMQAKFTGQRANEALKKIGELTYSSIYVENDKIKFGRFSVADTPVGSYGSEKIIALENTLDDRMLLNKVYVSAAYSADGDYFGIATTSTDSSSISRYGTREETLQDTVIWLVDSVSALGQAQRAIHLRKEIKGQFRFRTPLVAVPIAIGDIVQLSDPHLQIDDLYRVLEESFDMENGTRELMVDQTQLSDAFQLDYSALDSSDVLI